jgi:hypothetical protein
MRAKLTFLSALSVGLLGGVLAAGCQTYDFEPVKPLALAQTTETRRIEARERKPNLMLLVDTSGSMTDPVDPTDPDCKVGTQTCGGPDLPCNTAVCPTRWSSLQEAMQDFLESSGSLARIGLTTYPKPEPDGQGYYCVASTDVSIELPSPELEDDISLQAKAQQVRDFLLSIKNSSTSGERTPTGGTPTSASLLKVGEMPLLQSTEREDFVLLLTDGLPNCNGSHPTPYPNSGCFCTLAGGCSFAPEIGCLDDAVSVNAVNALRAKEIKTIVIGFGADFNAGSDPNSPGARGAATLNAMAEVGGFARACSLDADCGVGDTCDTTAKLCTRRFYKATNKDELVAALRQISEKVGVGDPCLLRFDPLQRPTAQELVVVYVNGERLEPGPDSWSLVDEGIQFVGATCSRIQNSTPANPVDIEVRAVQTR